MHEEEKFFTSAAKPSKRDYISLDGSTGKIYAQAIPTVAASISGYFSTLMGWADEMRVLDVRTNADTPKDAAQAAAFGAQGIGLTRTEHMFFETDRIKASRDERLKTRSIEELPG
jgi:pyruvate,orthophosphate dikinase